MALDMDDKARARETVRRLGPFVDGFKIGLEFFSAFGPKGIEEVMAETEKPLFLDLKFHDIPNTVAAAVRSVLPLRPFLLTLHASGGKAMLKAAGDAAREEAEKRGYMPPLLLGVTVLTSLDEGDLSEIGYRTPLREQVVRLGKISQDAGLNGLVCSGREIATLREELGQEMLLVVPGIRPQTDEQADQKRSVTPEEALLAGANILVIGRPILAAKDPIQAAMNIRKSLEKVE